MDGREVTVPVCEFSKSGALRVVIVDESELSFVAGKARRNCKSGHYAVHWFARGNPGDAFGMTITKPASAESEVKGTLDETGKDAGLFWIKVKS